MPGPPPLICSLTLLFLLLLLFLFCPVQLTRLRGGCISPREIEHDLHLVLNLGC
ncbi:hypothetical protein LY78DRAFT_655121 [Colletotrichum sublineola]|nr:hypothetical protein LY78DRAFT_655121 [Colletotrichum sublineola]